MKRLLILCMILCALASLCFPCSADQMPLEMTDAQAKAGQTVYLAVALNESVTANAIGVKCEFDKALLKALPDYSTWEIEGILSAFKADNDGAWASQSAQDVTGKLFVLAFQVKDGTTFPYTNVKCTVVLKNADKEVGNYTVEGSISSDCQHTYGNWKSAGTQNHVRVCTICGQKNSQNHQWDQGKETETQQHTTLLTKTCLVCRQQSIWEVSNQTGQMTPVGPTELTQATNPNKEPQPGQSQQTAPVEIGQTKATTGTSHHEHTHATQPSQTRPGITHPEHSHAGATQPDHSDHNHTVNEHESLPIWVFAILFALTLAGLTIYVKKKH